MLDGYPGLYIEEMTDQASSTVLREDEIDALVEEIRNNPEKIFSKDITDDQILRIQKKLNPYALAPSSEEDKVAMISYTNMEEDYMKRFLMTGLIGFLYRMVKEVEIEEEARSWDEADQIPPKLHREETNPLTYAKLRGIYDSLGSMLPALKHVEEEEKKIEMKRLALDIEDRPLPEADAAAAVSLRASRGALLYGATYLLTISGKDAEKRWAETEELCKLNEDVMKEIAKRPVVLSPPPQRRTMPEGVARGILSTFLNSFFEYNPDEHVASAMKDTGSKGRDTDDKDPSRPTLDLLRRKVDMEGNKYSCFFESREAWNSISYLLSQRRKDGFMERTLEVLSDPEGSFLELTRIREETGLLEKIPPSETFHRWNYYMEVNMEEIRHAVSAIYDEKPGFDLLLMIYDVLEGTEEETVDMKKTAFFKKYGEEMRTSVYGVQLGKWALLGNYKENRKEIDFMNRNTEVLKRILDRHEEDRKLGGDMMKKRVKKAKAKSIKEAGVDAESIKEYQRQLHDLAVLGTERGLNEDELREMENAKNNLKQLAEVIDVPEDAIQVNVFQHNATEGTMTKTAIYTEAEKPTEVSDTGK